VVISCDFTQFYFIIGHTNVINPKEVNFEYKPKQRERREDFRLTRELRKPGGFLPAADFESRDLEEGDGGSSP
jgi:hypothetical protein